MNGTVMHSSNGFTQRVKLLVGKDGWPIALGDYRYGEDGERWRIVGIGEKYVWGNQPAKGGQKRLKPEWLTKECPDSWERIIIDAMDTLAIQYCVNRGLEVNPAGENRETKIADLVHRCEKLARVKQWES